jgi:hypothetical protein
MDKNTPATALVLDCSDDAFATDQQQILNDIGKAINAGDVEAVRANCDALEQLLTEKPSRETRVTLAGDDLANYHAIHAEGFEHKKIALNAVVQKRLSATADAALAALETGNAVPKAVQTHRSKLRAIAAAIVAAKTHQELDAIEIPEPSA